MTPASPATRESRARAVAHAAVAGAVAGLAAWLTRGQLDVVSGAEGAVRVAMLPALHQLLPSCVVGAAAGLLLTWAAARLSATSDRSPLGPAYDVVLPWWITGSLVLPYLPIVPDRWPALTMLAGPGKYVVWALAAIMSARAVAHRVTTGRWRRGPARLAVVLACVGALSAAVCGTAAWRLVGTVFPGGDEPHYLVIAQSLWRDGDLRIENNHQRGDTLEYYPVHLAPHYLTRGTDGEIYSVHPVGLAVAAAPVYAAGGYRAVVAMLVALATLAGLLSWWLAWRVTGSALAATFGWAGAALGPPFVFNSFTVYPEIAGALMAIAAYGLAMASRPSRWSWLGCGLALASLPWLSTKYVPMAGALGLVALARLWRPTRVVGPDGHRATATRADRLWATGALAVPPAVSLAGWFGFFWAIWGRLSPSAPYGGASGTEARHLWSGAPGLWLDQEYGLLTVAPVLALAIVGLVLMARERTVRRVAIEIAVTVVSLWATVGAFHLWWGGSAAIGRPLVSALPLLAVPVAWAFERSRRMPALAAGYLTLLVIGLTNVVVIATQNRGLLLASGRDGSSQLLDWWSPLWSLSAIAPTFIVDPALVALRVAAAWLVPAVVAGVALAIARPRPGTGLAGTMALFAAAAAMGVATLVAPAARGAHTPPSGRLDARSSTRLLDDYAPSLRPLAVRYMPFERIAASEVPPLFRFDARPDDRRRKPPVAVLNDARWSLPPGRYEVGLVAPASASWPEGELGLQLGRLGPPIEAWPVTPDGTGRWATTFDLPVYVESVGFRASSALAAIRPTLVVRPVTVADRADEAPRREVLQAMQYGTAWVLFHTGDTAPEAGGFWTRARRRTAFTVVSRDASPMSIRVRAGAVPTGVTAIVAGRSQRLHLAAGEQRELVLPPHGGASWRVEVEADAAFVPAAVDPASDDRRELGCWVEIGVTPSAG